MKVLLDVQSCYTLLECPLTPKQIAATAKQLGFEAVALCDFGVLYGALPFYQACLKEGIKPLFGLGLPVLVHDLPYPFLLIAKSAEGYQNLLKASSTYTYNNKPLTLEQLASFANGNTLIVYGEGGCLEPAMVNESVPQLVGELSGLKATLNDFWVGISDYESAYWNHRNQLLIQACAQSEITPVALPKVRYATAPDQEIARVLLAIKKGSKLNDKEIAVAPGRYFHSSAEFADFYPEILRAPLNQFLEQPQIDPFEKKTSLPVYENKAGVDNQTYLKQLCITGLKKRFAPKEVPEIYKKRLLYELSVLFEMGFENYFLIVWDFILQAHRLKIRVGPGRGSAGGALVSYVLGITHIDPVAHGLLFERFLNPERISMPDIDIDFQDNRRGEILQYVYEKYGADHVAHIATFGTLKARAVLRDVARVLGYLPREVDEISKLIPADFFITLQKAYDSSQAFARRIEANERNRQLFSLSKRLEGLPRHVSTHAAGIVMSERALYEVVPTVKIENEMVSTQYTMGYLEELGLIKMDFLGLINLTTIEDTLAFLPEPPDLYKIDMKDPKTFTLLQNIDTMGVFQLESEGMKNLLRKLKPVCFDDIVVTIALFRPGPMQNIDTYLKARQNPKSIHYLHPKLKPILEETYGIMIYQEQIMQVASTMAGFSLGKADILRKAMAKKDEATLRSVEADFIEGCLSQGHNETLAKQLFELILRFANYGFNKAHSVAYGIIAYQTAYLKANYPLAFYASLLNTALGAETKTQNLLTECRQKGINVLPPCVNHSGLRYTIEGQSIRYPLSGLRNVGTSIASQILTERQAHGDFADFHDFVARVLLGRVNRKAVESFIDGGALDFTGENRAVLRASLPEAISYGELARVEKDGLFQIDPEMVSKPLLFEVAADPNLDLEKEKEVFGFYFSNHPISYLKERLHFTGDTIAQALAQKHFTKILGVLKRVRTHRTPKGDLMAFCILSDETGELSLTVFPSTYKMVSQWLVTKTILEVRGTIETNREASCVVNSLSLVSDKAQERSES
ncbi:MAG: DNA polymerase III subunit alpha [Erysipelotrichaceae bacterium]|jgi:DNA polymerase-3 subunit alpha|nr:DNA polymerase III subunit alpha [Erysipelotrichaceae bacterium]